MTAVELPPCSFDAVSAFYSITHVPRDEHAMLLKRIAGWLKSGGWFLASFGVTALDGCRSDWLGTTKFFSQHNADETKPLVLDAGLLLEQVEVVRQDNEETEWPAAARPANSHISSRSRRASPGIPSSSSTFDVGRRFRCTMRVDCGELDPGAVIRPVPGKWHPRIPERLDEEEPADWRAGRNPVSARRIDPRRAPCGRRRISAGIREHRRLTVRSARRA